MTVSTRSHWLVIAGLVGLVGGAVDPLEGSPVIAIGSGLVALGAYLGKSRRRGVALVAFAAVVAGIAAMGVLSAIGGVGGTTGRSAWWATLVAPMVVGWVLGLFTAVRMLIDRRRGPHRDGGAAVPDRLPPPGPVCEP